MKIKIPVPIKLVVTLKTKEKLLMDIEKSIEKIKLELEQLQFQHKKLISEAQKKGNEAVRIVHDRIGHEHQKRKEKLDILMLQLEQIERLEEGDEILHDTVEAEIDVKIGDSWENIITSREIILKDGVIIEIREGEK